MMEKYLVDIEFRYLDKKPEKNDCDYISKTITIGIYNTLEEANEAGNKQLEFLEKHFELHKFPQGHYVTKERFGKNGGYFGLYKDLITNLAYLKTPFSFYANVKKLQYGDLDTFIKEAMDSCERYRKYKVTLSEN